MLMPGRQFSDGSYRYGYNGMEKDDEIAGAGMNYDFGARMYNSSLARWNSVDPSAGKFPGSSPYNYVLDNPVVFVDPDGRENVIYLVVTKETAERLGVVTLMQIVDQANKILSETMDVKTQVHLFRGEASSFDQKYLDKTDTYAFLGTKSELVEITSSENYSMSKYDAEELNKLNPEKSAPFNIAVRQSTLAQGILVSENHTRELAIEWSEDPLEFIAFLIVHGAIHNSRGKYHVLYSRSLLANGDMVNKRIKNGGKLKDFINDPNSMFKKEFEKNNRFGTNPSNPNYYNKLTLDILRNSMRMIIKNKSQGSDNPSGRGSGNCRQNCL